MFQIAFITIFALFLSACESNPPAPVVDHPPQSSKPQASSTTNANQTSKAGKDWRPDTHIVKKGDTLFSIGLEYGFEYKEIAAANNISEPYPIQIGQKLNLAGLKSKAGTADDVSQNPSDDGVIISPIKTDPAIETTAQQTKPVENKTAETKPVQSAGSPILTEPKSIRELYSLAAFNKTTPVKPPETKIVATNVPTAIKPADSKPIETKSGDSKANETKIDDSKVNETKPSDNKPVETKTSDAKPAGEDAVNWIWPTQGKVVASFNEATNKGIDISGSMGQAINAASSGKVIYSGADLRGYGKLVIIKHNKTYLSVYAHNSKLLAKEGQLVAAGQKIAEMGNTDSNTVKLHFEIRRLGKSVDPTQYLNPN